MQALVRQGAAVLLMSWDDVGERAGLADLFVLRTTWDYWERLPEFQGFLRAFEARADDGHPILLNPPRTALNNLDKRYLEQLEGVPTVPTIYVRRGEERDAIDRARKHGWVRLVAKPTVGAASSGLELFDAQAEALHAHLVSLTAAGQAMVQPYMPAITSDGETSLVFFEGVFSHAVNKMPAPGEFRSQVDFGGVYTTVEPTTAQRKAAKAAIEAWETRFGDRLLYARVDLVPGDNGDALLGELELIEPELFLHMDRGAADRFAAAMLSRLDAQGK